MRIAIFSDTYPPDKNGISMSIDSFTSLMAADGHELMIFCPKKGLHIDKPRNNIKIKRYTSFTAPSNKDSNIALPFILSIVRDLKEFNPDIVHIQTPLGIGAAAIWATKLLKLKNIQTYHTYIPDFLVYFSPKMILGFDKITNYINNSKLAKSIESRADISDKNEKISLFKRGISKVFKEVDSIEIPDEKNDKKFKEKFGKRYTRLFYNRADLVLTPSAALKNILKKQGIHQKIEVMSNGVNVGIFKKKSNYSITNKMIHAGRLGYEKSTAVVIEAFYIAQKINPNLRLDVYGDGPARKSLQRLVKSLKVHKMVKFYGYYDVKTLSKKLCEYDFFVTASKIETQGIVLLEAMSSGLPIVAVDKLAIPEIVKNGKNGYLSKADDAEAMAKNMVKIVESQKRIEKFSKKSVEIAKTHELIKCKERLFKFYQKIAK